MMINPPIDKLLEKTGCKYALVCLISKRARQLIDKKPFLLEESGTRPITYAAKEVYKGEIKLARE